VGELVVHGGAIHFSKEFILKGDEKSFGTVYRFNDGWIEGEPIGYLSGLSQEHGIVKLIGENSAMPELGSWLGVVPIHSCLTANLMRNYYLTDEGVVRTMNS
jgi:D-serine deaminase-like pyridoxal phosphate-dependent protein